MSGRRHSDPPLAVFTSTRADFGILRPLLDRLAEDGVPFGLIVTGSHLSDRHGATVDEVRSSGHPVLAEVQLDLDSGARPERSVASTIASAIERLDVAVDRLAPHRALVLGDRFEAFAFATVCHGRRVPLAHLHGGEITEGALDDAYRHCITKLASLHLVAGEEFADRVIRMGEQPHSVHVTGALGLDAIRRRFDTVALPDRGDAILLAFHPETLGSSDPASDADRLVRASVATGRPVIATGPNADPGGDAIRSVLHRAAASGQIDFVESLGSDRFVPTLASAAVMVGNSSAGIIEAPFVGTPTVNVGHRQHGRPRAATVVDVDLIDDRLAGHIESATRLATAPLGPTPYGDGRSAGRVAAAVTGEWTGGAKRFFDGPLHAQTTTPIGA